MLAIIFSSGDGFGRFRQKHPFFLLHSFCHQDPKIVANIKSPIWTCHQNLCSTKILSPLRTRMYAVSKNSLYEFHNGSDTDPPNSGQSIHDSIKSDFRAIISNKKCVIFIWCNYGRVSFIFLGSFMQNIG